MTDELANARMAGQAVGMDYDKDKVDEMVLALLFLTLHGDGRAWKWNGLNAMACVVK